MSAKVRSLGMLAVGLLLAACIAGSGGAAKDRADSVNPITGGDIEVTALDAPAAKLGGAAETTEKATAEQPDAGAAAAGAKPGTEAKPKPDGQPAPDAQSDLATAKGAETPEIPAPEAAPLVTEELKTAAQKACEKKGNHWVKAGKSGASACMQRMKDAGKRCVNGTQCQGECLARSMTCSPYQPLFGCNEILQDNGVRMTLCID